MKRLVTAREIGGGQDWCLACAACRAGAASAGTADINGQNSWSDASGDGVPTLATNVMDHTGRRTATGYQSGSLVMDAVAGNPFANRKLHCQA